jgi:hypothetical protein
VTNTPTVTATPSGECLTFLDKLKLLVNVLHHLGAKEGQRRYDARYDLNHDGRINIIDAVLVLKIPLCPR